jgi:hypothetical protein
MLLDYAGSDYADFGTDNIRALFDATGWDLGDLRPTVLPQTGGPITLFATTQKQWGDLSLDEELLKLRTNPAWKPHLVDALLSMMVAGAFRGEDLKRWYDEEGGDYQLKTLNGGSLTIGYDAANNFILIDGRPIFVANMKGVDGYVLLLTYLFTCLLTCYILLWCLLVDLLIACLLAQPSVLFLSYWHRHSHCIRFVSFRFFLHHLYIECCT